MTISALVVTLDPEAPARALAVLAADPRLILGNAIDCRLPVCAETTSAREGAALVDDLLRVTGVLSVDVVCIDFSEEMEWTAENS